ncbi:YjcZ family sporulation protein [Peribacillus butanolivorans]|uniref:YjcZ family sporulation protein n=1 Tax=Peribacillus butanolivorans TaxID=421767 RepID=UPI003D273FF4
MFGFVSRCLDGFGFCGGFAFIVVLFILLSIVGIGLLVEVAHETVKDYEKSRP